ncbi:MAG TPA: hypothetical protein VLV15_04565, partial [Dongiaceae bacterium]|nr:hypothetical protein [Dongiaceae bacterium]
MCGIAGLMSLDGRLDTRRLHAFSELLRHRGPDDEGIALFDPERRITLTLGGADTPEAAYRSPLRYAPGRWEQGARPATAPADARFRVGLVHRRLSILDLSPAGHQPMCDATGEIWLTFNGEIYNF